MSGYSDPVWNHLVTMTVFGPSRAEDSTENGSGSKRCEYQGCPNLFYFMCLFIKPVIFGTATLATG